YKDAVPEGYCVWTAYATGVPAPSSPTESVGTVEGAMAESKVVVAMNDKPRGWLNSAPGPSASPTSSNETESVPHFPAMVQAGTELFTPSLQGFLASEIVEDPQG